MEGIGNKGKGMDRITCFSVIIAGEKKPLNNGNDGPAMSSNRKKAVSTTSRMMILLVLESAMVVVLRRAQWRDDPRQEEKKIDGCDDWRLTGRMMRIDEYIDCKKGF